MTDKTPPSQPSTPIWRWLLLVSVAICAASGLVYELALLTLSASLNGGGVVETSLIVAGYVASLGLGALLAKPFLKAPAQTFLVVEALLGVVGGASALALYIVFATVGQSLVALVISTLAIGVLVGAELPLLMTLIQQGKMTDARGSGSLLATLNFADYVGAWDACCWHGQYCCGALYRCSAIAALHAPCACVCHHYGAGDIGGGVGEHIGVKFINFA